MLEAFNKYPECKRYITIKMISDGSYDVFTEPTQHFNVRSLEDITPECIEGAILFNKQLKEKQEFMFMEFCRLFELKPDPISVIINDVIMDIDKAREIEIKFDAENEKT